MVFLMLVSQQSLDCQHVAALYSYYLRDLTLPALLSPFSPFHLKPTNVEQARPRSPSPSLTSPPSLTSLTSLTSPPTNQPSRYSLLTRCTPPLSSLLALALRPPRYTHDVLACCLGQPIGRSHGPRLSPCIRRLPTHSTSKPRQSKT